MESMLEKQESDAECGFSDGVVHPSNKRLLPSTYSMLAIVYPAISFRMRISRPLLLTYPQRRS